MEEDYVFFVTLVSPPLEDGFVLFPFDSSFFCKSTEAIVVPYAHASQVEEISDAVSALADQYDLLLTPVGHQPGPDEFDPDPVFVPHRYDVHRGDDLVACLDFDYMDVNSILQDPHEYARSISLADVAFRRSPMGHPIQYYGVRVFLQETFTRHGVLTASRLTTTTDAPPGFVEGVQQVYKGLPIALTLKGGLDTSLSPLEVLPQYAETLTQPPRIKPW
jgi:hypothetical protein